MTADLLQQLDAYGSYVDDIVPPITEAEVEIRFSHVRDSVVRGPSRVPGWGVAVAAAVVVLVLIGGLSVLFGGSDPSVEPAGPSPEPTVTVPVDNNSSAMLVTPPIDATWTLEAAFDGWLTEPVSSGGAIWAMLKGLGEDSEISIEGFAEGSIEAVGEVWTSADGSSWVPAGDGVAWPPPVTEEPTTVPSVTVEYDDRGTPYGVLVTDRLTATTDGLTWREINLRPFEDNWIPRVAQGGFGWLVFSPPWDVSVGAESLASRPRESNLGLWYTPDTVSWFEVTDLGPLTDMGDHVGAFGVIDAAFIVRDDDIVVLTNLAENLGFGWFSQLRTEIWRIELDA